MAEALSNAAIKRLANAARKRLGIPSFARPLLRAIIGMSLLLLLVAAGNCGDDSAASPDTSAAVVEERTPQKNTPKKESPEKDTPVRPFRTTVVRGRVVWLEEAIKRQFGIQSVPAAAKRTLALETPDGELRLLIEDARGHAFRVDERLRKMDLKLLVREFDRSPLLQVVRVFQVVDGVDFEVDYWCEICAIAMIELKACDCCQGAIELRKRRQTSPLGDLKKSSSR